MNAEVRHHTAKQDNDSGEQLYGTRVLIGRNVMGRTRVLEWDRGNVTGHQDRAGRKRSEPQTQKAGFLLGAGLSRLLCGK